MTTISTAGLNSLLTSSLTAEKSQLETLNESLATGLKYNDLTAFTPTAAKSIVDFNNTITQKQSYLDSITTVQTRLSLYDTTMTNLESIASSASDLASQNQNYNAATATDIQDQAQNYLTQVASDLNLKSGDRYLYAGTRYTAPPVTSDTSILNGAPQTIITNGVTLPDYDAQITAASQKVTYMGSLPAGATVGFSASPTSATIYDASGTSHTVNYTWTKTSSDHWSLNVAVPDATYTATIPFTFDPTTGSLASVSSGSGYSVGTPTSTGAAANANIALTFGSQSAQTISLNFGSYGSTSSASGLTDNSTTASISTTTFSPDGSTSYVADSVNIEDAYNLKYGVSSNNPAFQKLINGLRYLNAAVTAGSSGDTTTYQSDMQQASTLLKDALSSIQSLHANVAYNIGTLTQQTSTLSSDLTSLKSSLTSTESSDPVAVSTEITILQTQLQASYSATGSLLKLSLVNYL